MPEFTASIFATQSRTMSSAHSLSAYALLFEGSRPYWELYIRGSVIRFIAHPDYILEEGLSQLFMYLQIPDFELKHDESKSAFTLEEEFGERACKEMRDQLIHEWEMIGCHIHLTTWPEVHMPRKKEQLDEWEKMGLRISHSEVTYLLN